MNTAEKPRVIAILNAGVSDPSSSRMLADRTAHKTLDLLHQQSIDATLSVVELRPLATEIAHTIVGGFASEKLQSAIDRLAAADALIVSTPIYKAGISGLLKSFVDVLDNDLLIAKPVALAATAGTSRHAMVVDEHMRPLFAFMRALAIPTSLFAAPEDWGDAALTGRIERAATELAALVASGVGNRITSTAWGQYQHTFGSTAQPTDGTEHEEVDFSSSLMKLAAGGASTIIRKEPAHVSGKSENQR